ncbi:formylmethanofuran dehydrogenase subunit A [Variovorax paradoxus]|uniref:formylmethanofuran dehydrogenase subunit A n=1 Tax=Variovorax paradoxus TaxID=34073 RepID=UPI002789E37B|nr:formylmethanofuran dehydrogenase subunit A [Variovorax paradoxus]MDP9929035.1 formylmethanofuran dehydrogenase subunit A [Variovorax paradoxus]
MTATLRLRGGRVIDPGNGCDEVRDLYVRDGRMVELAPHEAATEEIDLGGCIVMAGGIDMHTHIGGGKVNLARMLLPEDHRANANPVALPDNVLELASCGTCTPGTLATGYRYVEMGYTAAFEPAMMACNARHTHMEMGDTPILDHGAYVMLGNDELFLRMLAERWDFERIRDYAGWTINASKAMGVKVVNPGGISAFKFNQRKLDVDENHVHWQVTPRQVVHTLARALRELGVPHPLHIHGSNLGVAGNIQSTLDTIAALDGLPGHLTHIQFHAYGTEGPKKFSSAALQLAEVVNANKNVSIDVGQIMFGQTVTASGDTMRQHAQSGLADPRKWLGADIECEAGCGVVPFRYREQSYVNALQWVIGLEIFLLVDDPWRVVLTTDHPNGGPFTSYPHLIRLLMDRSFREEQLAKLHPEVAAQAALRSITRELSLYEIAIMTRAGPARLLGLPDRGHLGAGAAADIAVYRENPDREAMFATPEYVFKDGVLVSRAGRVTAAPVGGTHFVAPNYDRGIEQRLRRHLAAEGSVNFDHIAIGHDELCQCCNGGRLLPAACFQETSSS